ncbi:plac8 onzin related protein 6 [Genypterus blacodes]|uniref:plac8 onzin related protein 6 n=1 Tax=Genypterus blacodes TaxID=154954 RepID=UPI003F764A70
MAVHPISAHIVTAQPAILTSPLNLKIDMWTSGIFNCCDDMGTCCFGFWCPCCQACQLSSDFGECMCMPMVDMVSCGMVPAYALALRSSMRERYHLQGSIFDDCCIVTFCGSCAWCQMARELKRRKGLLLHNTTTTMEVTMNPMPHAPTYIANPMQPIPAGIYPPQPQ